MPPSLLYRLFEHCLTINYQTTSSGADYAVLREGDTLYLFFEHSRGSEDWLNNLNFRIRPYHDMHPVWYCHAGFLRVFRSLLPHLLPVIKDPSVRQMFLVGYSHGGALAVLCHEAAVFHRPELARHITTLAYGAPRVLAAPIPHRVKKRFSGLYLIQHRGDIVTRLPPTLLGYRHVGSRVMIGESGLSPIDAHRPESYLLALSRR